MTLPDERYRAVLAADQFLQDLMDSRKTPRVPRAIRERARSVLRHYPGTFDMQRVAAARPDIFQERMEPLHRMVLAHQQLNIQSDDHEGSTAD